MTLRPNSPIFQININSSIKSPSITLPPPGLSGPLPTHYNGPTIAKRFPSVAQNQVKKLSIRHEAILQYLLANPTAKYSEVAGHFGVTPAWLSVVVHSEAFQEQLRARQDELFDSTVVAGLESKLTAAADMTLQEYMDKIPSLSADQLSSSADRLLGRLGFGSQKGTINANNVQVNYNMDHVPREVVDAARAKIGTAQFALGAAGGGASLQAEAAPTGSQEEGV